MRIVGQRVQGERYVKRDLASPWRQMESDSCWKVQEANDDECGIGKTSTAHSGDPEGYRRKNQDLGHLQHWSEWILVPTGRAGGDLSATGGL